MIWAQEGASYDWHLSLRGAVPPVLWTLALREGRLALFSSPLCSLGSKDNICLCDRHHARNPIRSLPTALALSRKCFPQLFAWKIPAHPSNPWQLMGQSLVLSWDLHYTVTAESEAKSLKCWSVCCCFSPLLNYRLQEPKGFIIFIFSRNIINSVGDWKSQWTWKPYETNGLYSTIYFQDGLYTAQKLVSLPILGERDRNDVFRGDCRENSVCIVWVHRLSIKKA